MNALRDFALRYPEAEEGIACAGTAAEKRTVKARNKAFLFLGLTEAMLKLDDSLPEATALAAKHPTGCKVGAHGWVTVKLGDDAVPLEVLEKWIDESYRLLAPKQLVGLLPAGNAAKPGKKTAKKPAPKKSAKRKSASR